MTIKIEPEIGVPLFDDDPAVDLTVRAQAARTTALELAEHGLELKPNKEDEDVSTLTPASLVLTGNILTEFGASVVESAVTVRHLVTNKLILETENPDPRVRIRALELLGKISDVGLFSEKSEVTVTHQSTDDLKAKLRRKLEKLVNPVEEIVLDGEIIDLDVELGISASE
jgi:hypothetical protein